MNKKLLSAKELCLGMLEAYIETKHGVINFSHSHDPREYTRVSMNVRDRDAFYHTICWDEIDNPYIVCHNIINRFENAEGHSLRDMIMEFEDKLVDIPEARHWSVTHDTEFKEYTITIKEVDVNEFDWFIPSPSKISIGDYKDDDPCCEACSGKTNERHKYCSICKWGDGATTVKAMRLMGRI